MLDGEALGSEPGQKSAGGRAIRACGPSPGQVLGQAGRTDVDAGRAVALGAALLGHSFVQKARQARPVARRGPVPADRRGEGRGLSARAGAQRLPAEKAFALPVEAQQTLQFAVMQGTSIGRKKTVLGRAVDSSRALGRQTYASASAPRPAHLCYAHRQADRSISPAEASESAVQQLLAESPLPSTTLNWRVGGDPRQPPGSSEASSASSDQNASSAQSSKRVRTPRAALFSKCSDVLAGERRRAAISLRGSSSGASSPLWRLRPMAASRTSSAA